MIFSKGEFMKIAIFEHDLTREDVEVLEDKINDFSLDVEIVDIKTKIIETNLGLVLFAIVLYK